ncbi:MAG TPA: magnesium protoporphyrin IX methyltransferase [Hyphomicrobiaceae bacterium]|nr:magnesium protoporphyrin IX methyltransferase [Hyphomicrobiaceae bacterium]
MPTATYIERRKELETYFDRTAVEAWEKLTSDAPVGRIRATVREGRNDMRRTIVGWLPEDLSGRRVLDAGCGTGALAVELASRGADVLAIDLSPRLVELARERYPARIGRGRVTFRVGDMLSRTPERFDHAIAMDSLIHYEAGDIAKALALLASQVEQSITFTFVPRTPLLVAMHSVGRLFPSSNRSPSFRPLGNNAARSLVAGERGLSCWHVARGHHVSRGFYTSEAMELRRR